jgi:hypothetical protein
MAQPFAKPSRRVRLTFRDHQELAHVDEAIRSELSAVADVGSCLFTANDEFATVERLVRQEDGNYGHHKSFQLAEFFDLPDGPGGGMDIEGLDAEAGYLWIVGSHSVTRRKPDPRKHGIEEALARLTEVTHRTNRHFLGRVPLIETDEAGVFDLAAKADDGNGTIRRSACLKLGSKGGKLEQMLADDVHIRRFMGVPAKENGFDVEGLAVRGNHVFLGLRGPVLRGWAILLELLIEEQKPGRLKPRKLGKDGQPYVKHFLDLDGLGVRELELEGDDLLILAGPTMDLDGPVMLYRWPNCLAASEQTIVPESDLELVLTLPYGHRSDHAEGMCWLGDEGAARELLMVYDLPASDREHDGTAIDADVFRVDRPPRPAQRGRKSGSR